MVLTAAVIVLTVLVLINLVLSAAIIRRLRETEAQLADVLPATDAGLQTGTPMPDFSSTDGSFTRAELAGTPVLMGFFSTECRYCPTQAEQLAHRATGITERGIRVVNIVTAINEEAPDTITPILEKSGIVIADGPGGLMAAFSVSGTPTFLLFDGNGTLLGKGHTIDEALERWIA
jgi:thioredoxin-related protein